MAAENNLSGGIGLDTTAFKKGVLELTNQMKQIETSFRASAAVMGNWSSSTQGLTERVASLQQKLDLQKEALNRLHSEYDLLSSAEGNHEKEQKSLADQMYSMGQKISSTEGQLKKYQSALQSAEKEEKENNSSVEKLGKSFQDFAKQSKSTSDTVKSHFSGLKSIFSGLGGAIAGFAVSLGAGFSLKGIIDSADAAEKTAAQMNAVLSSTKGIAGMTASQLNDLAASQAKVTTFSAGTTKQAENMLLTFTNIHSNVFPQTIKATEDMATAMHTDATSAAQQLGKALNDPATGYTKLQRVGVTFSASQIQTIKTMEKAGNTAGAQKIILQELEKEFGGSAEAAGSTFSGQLQIAQNTLKSVGATIGTALLPAIKQILPQLVKWGQNLADTIMSHKADIQNAITNVSDGIQKLFAFISSNGGTIKGIIAGIATTFALWKIADLVGTAVGAIKNMKTALEGAKTAQEAFNIAMGGNPIGLIIIAIGLLVAAFVALWNNCEGFRNFWIGLWAGIKTAAQAVGSWFSGPFIDFFKGAWSGIQGAFSNVGNWFKSAFDGAKSGIQSTWSNAGSWFSNAGNSIKSTFNSTIEWIKNNWKSLALFLVNPIAGAVSLLYNNNPKFKTWADSAMQTIKNGVTTGMNAVKGAFTAAWNGIVTVVKAIIQPFVNGILDFWRNMQTGLSDIMNGVKTMLSGAWELIKNIVMAPVLLICDLITGNFSQMGTDLSTIWTNIQNAFKLIWDGILQLGQGFTETIMSILQTAWQHITENITLAWNGIVAFFTTTWATISTGVQTFWNALPGFFSNLWVTIRTGITTAWNAVVQFFAQLWVNIGNGIRSAWTGFWTTINNLCGTIKNGIINIWNSILAWFRALPGTLLTIGANMFTSMQNGVNSTINNVTSAIKTGIGAAIDWIKALPGEAIQWGRDIINGIVQGIKDAADAVGDAVKGVAQNIRKFLHFSVPDEGPLVDFASWMPDMMTGLAKGIEANKYKVVAAMQGLAADMSIAPAVRPAYAGAYSAPAAAASSGSTIINYTTNINSPAAPTPSSVNRVERQSAQRIALIARRH